MVMKGCIDVKMGNKIENGKKKNIYIYIMKIIYSEKKNE